MISWKKLKSKIPHLVKFNDRVYEVCWVEKFKSDNVLGETRFEPTQIVIKSDMENKETVKTYLHEVIHAISFEYGANLTETQVLALEEALKDILKKGNIFKE